MPLGHPDAPDVNRAPGPDSPGIAEHQLGGATADIGDQVGRRKVTAGPGRQFGGRAGE
jgi:hypothetical protein